MKTPKLFIDEAFCWGCRTCEIACKQENQVPDGVRLITLKEDFQPKKDGSLNFTYHLNVCRHCDDPPCATVCPVEAIEKRKDGIVILDHDECTGCGMCLEACPYDAIAFDEASNTARKCNNCFRRLDNGLLPACADNVCPGHCIHFGERDAARGMPFGVRASG
jgi:Fe-S-cluster-containing dehydrogenase component